MNVLAGQEVRYTNRTENSQTSIGVVYGNGSVVLTDPAIIKFFNLQNIPIESFDGYRDRFVGWFLNAAYSFQSRYILNVTGRYDASNQLGRKVASQYLPTFNVSGAWRVSQESFLSGVAAVDEMKLRFHLRHLGKPAAVF